MPVNSEISKILYGGDYNPEQWNEDIRKKDMEYLTEAGIDIVTLNVFNWAMIQPTEEEYDFEELDRTVQQVTENGMYICMATSTAAHPAWMATRYPEILRTEFNGMKRKFGGRHNSCPNSPIFRQYSRMLAEKLAEHYQNQQNIVAWHVSNEYGGACYCENCEKAFRIWLRKKYHTLEVLNKAWNTHFWGHLFYDWNEIVSPNLLSEHYEDRISMFPGITLDYKRFMSDSLLENFKEEYEAIRKWIPDAKITTNLMGLYNGLDYQKWGKCMDFISWDNYPAEGETRAETAFTHDLMRGLKRDQPFWLMEQAPSISNWLDLKLKRPGEMRLLSYQAIAHGADSIMFFQMRRNAASCEKFHGAIIDHVGNDKTRVFKECAVLGRELRGLGDTILGSMGNPRTAILYDWNNRWAIEGSSGLSPDIQYPEEVMQYYKSLYEKNVAVDVIGVNEDLFRYRLVIAPELYMIKPGVKNSMEQFVREGGTLVLSLYCGIVNENDYITCGGYPGELRELAGIWIEEFDALRKGENRFIYKGKEYLASYVFALLHAENAQVLSTYEKDFYAGMPVVTKNNYGKGTVYYVGTRSDSFFYQDFMNEVCKTAGITSVTDNLFDTIPGGVEITKRSKEKTDFYFCLNNKQEDTKLKGKMPMKDLLTGECFMDGEAISIPAYGVRILTYFS